MDDRSGSIFLCRTKIISFNLAFLIINTKFIIKITKRNSNLMKKVHGF